MAKAATSGALAGYHASDLIHVSLEGKDEAAVINRLRSEGLLVIAVVAARPKKVKAVPVVNEGTWIERNSKPKPDKRDPAWDKPPVVDKKPRSIPKGASRGAVAGKAAAAMAKTAAQVARKRAANAASWSMIARKARDEAAADAAMVTQPKSSVTIMDGDFYGEKGKVSEPVLALVSNTLYHVKLEGTMKFIDILGEHLELRDTSHSGRTVMKKVDQLQVMAPFIHCCLREPFYFALAGFGESESGPTPAGTISEEAQHPFATRNHGDDSAEGGATKGSTGEEEWGEATADEAAAAATTRKGGNEEGRGRAN
jgi:hypothetical protein